MSDAAFVLVGLFAGWIAAVFAKNHGTARAGMMLFLVSVLGMMFLLTDAKLDAICEAIPECSTEEPGR